MVSLFVSATIPVVFASKVHWELARQAAGMTAIIRKIGVFGLEDAGVGTLKSRERTNEQRWSMAARSVPRLQGKRSVDVHGMQALSEGHAWAIATILRGGQQESSCSQKKSTISNRKTRRSAGRRRNTVRRRETWTRSNGMMKPKQAVAQVKSWLPEEVDEEGAVKVVRKCRGGKGISVVRESTICGGEEYGQPMEDRTEQERQRDQVKSNKTWSSLTPFFAHGRRRCSIIEKRIKSH